MRPASVRSSVDFPAPFRPTTASRSPRRSVSETPSSSGSVQPTASPSVSSTRLPERPVPGHEIVAGGRSVSGGSSRSIRSSSFWRAWAWRVFWPAMLRRMNSSWRSISARCSCHALRAPSRRASRSRR